MSTNRKIDVFADTMAEKPSETLVSDSVISEGHDIDLAGEQMAHFRIDSLLRAGGMGTIWKALDISLDRPVALKVLGRELTRDEVLVERFTREARSQARLSHGNVVPIYYVGNHDGHMFFAMELIEGGSLADRLERGERLASEDAIDLMIGVGRALRHAHERGLIHRDVKPGNLLVDPSGHVKVADFGLARPVNNTDQRKLTGQGVFLGTPWYSSPEQARAIELDHRSDMYAMAATFYHLLVGKPLFDGRTPFVVLARHAADKPDLRPLRKVATPALVEIIEQMLQKKPDDRFDEHDHVVQALKAVRDSL